MNVIFEKLMYLIVGGAAGSLITSFIMKSKHDKVVDLLEDELDKYENRFDEEVEKARKAFIEGYGANETENDKNDDDTDNDDVEDLEKLKKISSNKVNQVKQAREKPDMERIIEKNGYHNEPEFDDEDEFEEEELDDSESPFLDEDDIVIITPEEFGEYSDYEKQDLYYLRDGILVDDQGNMIEDIDDMVGFDSLHQFGQYDDNHVFVRNYHQKTDFDIFRDTEHTYRNFRER